MTIENITDQYNTAFGAKDYERIGEIISLLNNEEYDAKKKAQSLYEKIGQDLFDQDRSLSNYNLDKFLRSIKDVDNKSKSQSKPAVQKNQETIPSPTFDQCFQNFFGRHEVIFLKLKDYYLFKIEIPDVLDKPEVLILCDDDSVCRPELAKIENGESILKVSKERIQDFVDRFNKMEDTQQGANYICILCLSPSLRDNDVLKNDLKNLFELFDPVLKILAQTDRNGALINYKFQTFNDETLAELLESTNKLFNNTKLSYEEQRIIKGFFGEAPAVLNYRVLKPGASGSSVIEVQANFTRTKDSKRYVIKIAPKETTSKLKIEMKQFKNNVAHFSNRGYSADYGETETLEAIKYNYASTDSISDSSSFSELLDGYLDNPTQETSTLSNVVKTLFDCDIVNGWNSPARKEEKSGTLYKSYIKNEAKVIGAIREIRNQTEAEVNESSLIKHYKLIKDYKLQTNVKVCHGDLHSENFFWDESNTYLIDFGFTGTHHALVDHATLELSVRLKHFPRYIPSAEIIEYEEKLFDLNSFDASFDVSFVKRQKLRGCYELIKQIRVDAKKYLLIKDCTREYLISLFFLAFRQIQYHDLNQQLALSLSELIGAKVVQLISEG